jgi:hypothetical protein
MFPKSSRISTRAQQLIGQYGANVNPRMYKLVAFASDSLGDYTAARAMSNFAKADSSIILPTDYEEFVRYMEIIGLSYQEYGFSILCQGNMADSLMQTK